MDNWPEHNKFFWKRYEDRAYSKLDGKGGLSHLKLSTQKIKITKYPGKPQHLCMICGSHLLRRYCKNCTELIDLYEKGKVYFVIDHFKGDDYTVVFFCDINHSKSKVALKYD